MFSKFFEQMLIERTAESRELLRIKGTDERV